MDVSADFDESYILLLLADSNLPTGAFVASAGLESYVKHGFLPSGPSASQVTMDFVRDSLASYARSALPFVSDAYRVVHAVVDEDGDGAKEEALNALERLDQYYETTTLNHVARRASTTQGVALLTLYSKGFSPPTNMAKTPSSAKKEVNGLVDQLKLMIRRGETHGHLPICWGVLTAALCLSLERAQHLHLFLHARSLLSASVRLNTLGPYAAQQLLLHSVRPLVAHAGKQCKDLCTGLLSDVERDGEGKAFDEIQDGPATTWPLGEILAARHDLQHSRIFNS